MTTPDDPWADRLAELAALEAQATPGPWRASLGLQVRGGDGRIVACWDCCKSGPKTQDEHDQEFIAAARNMFPDLLAAYAEQGEALAARAEAAESAARVAGDRIKQLEDDLRVWNVESPGLHAELVKNLSARIAAALALLPHESLDDISLADAWTRFADIRVALTGGTTE